MSKPGAAGSLLTSRPARWSAGSTAGWSSAPGRWETARSWPIPRSPSMQHDINRRVKGRESFRPLAPAVLWEEAGAWFDLDLPSPYMLRTCPVAAHQRLDVDLEPEDPVERVQVPRSTIPACTHVDGSARVQTVHRETSPLFHRLINAFADETGCPVLLNTSFNRAGEPIVCTPEDALASARAAELDLLVLETSLVWGEELDANPGDRER